ncbi:MAG: GNAT family N-acetyltransferase [Bradyrhizobiaceae bacterium]|nr:GNAT family N-acetyltransferase [Bradyrhizobiaceae bacterium]
MSLNAALALRRYHAADRDAVAQLNAYGLAAAGIDLDEDYYEGEDLADIDSTYGERARGFLVIGELNKQVVAMGGIRRLDNDTCELLRMRVAPDYQGRGYGRAVLNRLEAEARRLGYSLIQLITGEHQHPAVDLYLRHGYQVTKREMLLGIPSVYMAKQIV